MTMNKNIVEGWRGPKKVKKKLKKKLKKMKNNTKGMMRKTKGMMRRWGGGIATKKLRRVGAGEMAEKIFNSAERELLKLEERVAGEKNKRGLKKLKRRAIFYSKMAKDILNSKDLDIQELMKLNDKANKNLNNASKRYYLLMARIKMWRDGINKKINRISKKVKNNKYIFLYMPKNSILNLFFRTNKLKQVNEKHFRELVTHMKNDISDIEKRWSYGMGIYTKAAEKVDQKNADGNKK
tara:strand:+ start:244 stop:957 length:714 start_codon:yes stop_codon:yes gene_type:complete